MKHHNQSLSQRGVISEKCPTSTRLTNLNVIMQKNNPGVKFRWNYSSDLCSVKCRKCNLKHALPVHSTVTNSVWRSMLYEQRLVVLRYLCLGFKHLVLDSILNFVWKAELKGHLANFKLYFKYIFLLACCMNRDWWYSGTCVWDSSTLFWTVPWILLTWQPGYQTFCW